MALIALIIIYVIELIYSFKKTQSLFSPPVLFTAGFLACSIISTFYWTEWDMGSLHINTFLVLSLGVLLFNHVCLYFIKDVNEYMAEEYGQEYLIIDTPPHKIIVIWIFVQIVCYYLFGKTLQTVTYTDTVADAAFSMALTKNLDYNDISIPGYVSLFYFIVNTYTYVIYWLLAKELISKNRCVTTFTLLGISSVISIIGPLLGGSRGSSVTNIFSVFFIVYSFYLKECGNTLDLRFSPKLKVSILIAILLLSCSWSSIGVLIGREVKDDIGYNLAVYCGAEIKNLDIYLNSGSNLNKSKEVGHESFVGYYTYKNHEKNDKTHSKEVLDLPYQSYNNYELGNVYTCFYMFLYDFGYIGVPILIILMSFISSLLWNNIFRTGFIGIMCTLAYSIISFDLFFSFFSNKFFETICTTVFIKTIIFWAFLLFIIDIFGMYEYYDVEEL